MQQESGRSLIEMLGVLAIGGVMTAAAYGTYHMLRTSQTRNLAISHMEQIARNTKILLEMRGDYSPVSIDYLIKNGALTDNIAPIGGDNWSITPGVRGETFAINLTDLSQGDCIYFATKEIKWALQVNVNNIPNGRSESCMSAPKNLISVIVK